MMLFAALMVSADVLARRLFGLTMGGSDEISGYLFAIATSLAFPYALLTRSNVRIDAAYALLHPHVRAALDGGMSKAAVCRNFGIKRTTLIETLTRVGWPSATETTQQ